MPVEVEAKFLADGPQPLTALASEARLADALLAQPRTVQELDRYLDTSDGRLAARRWACRLRERPGRLIVSLKGPRQDHGGGWLHRRPEVEGPATTSFHPPDWPPSGARLLLEDLSEGKTLIEYLTLHQHRTERNVQLNGSVLGTLSLDVVRATARGRNVGPLHVVELELAGGADWRRETDLEHIVTVLAQRPGLTVDPRTKLEHAIDQLKGR